MSTGLAPTLYHHLAQREDQPSLVVDDVALTGAQVLSAVAYRQHQLRDAQSSHPVARGDRLIVMTGRGIATWIDALALWGLGATAILCEASMDDETLAHVQAKTQPSARILDEPFVPVTESITPIVDESDDTSLALILFTSGSTGLPKAVPLTRRTLLANATACTQALGLDAHTRLFAPVPFRFISAVSHFLVAILSDVCYQGTEARLMQADLIQRLKASGASAFGGSPMQALWLSQTNTAPGEVSLGWLMASGDHLPAATIHALRETFAGITVVTAYGLTELGGRYCLLDPRELPAAAGSVGQPIEGLGLRVIDEQGSPATVDTLGEVTVHGQHGFSGYLNDDETNAQVLREGVFHTGDLGRIDTHGRLWLTGRADDVFKSAGIKVSTQPIANALMSLGLFDDVAITAHPDASLGAVPHVFYCLAKDQSFVRGDVMRALRPLLKAGELPRHFTAVDAIPRTPSGKVKRAVLREWVKDGVGD